MKFILLKSVICDFNSNSWFRYFLKVTIIYELEAIKVQEVSPQQNSTHADFQKLLKVARAKPVDLPTYDGKSKAAYAGFKDSFIYIIERTNVPK